MDTVLPFNIITQIPMLSEEECLEVRSAIYDLKKLWYFRERGKATLGAASYMDAIIKDKARQFYYAKAKLFNPLLRKHFGWLYERLSNVLTKELEKPVCYQETFALPGIHIFFPKPTSFEGRNLLHQDFNCTLLKWSSPGDVDYQNPISFTLTIALPKCGGGLNLLDISLDEYNKLSIEEQTQIKKSAKLSFYPYKVGHLLIRSGVVFHKIAPMPDIQPGEERITLQGHGTLCKNTWHLYW